METVQEIPLARILPHPDNRHYGGFDEAKLAELAESIKAVGVQQPAVVRELDGHYELVAGERRWRASQIAGRETLPCVVRELDELTVLKIQTVENLQREDVHPLDEADGYARLIERGGYDVERVAQEVGKSPSYVYQRLKLRDLAPAARENLVEGKLTAGHAILLARLQPEHQEQALKEFARDWRDGHEVGVRELDTWIHRTLFRELSRAGFKKDDAELLPEAGPCTTCPKRTGNQPHLFADVSKPKDSCTDPRCWDAKLDALVKRRQAELGGQEHLKVMGQDAYVDHRQRKALTKQGVLDRYDVQECKKKDKGALPVLVVAGEDRGQLTYGKKREQQGYRHVPTAKEKARAQAAKQKRQLDLAYPRRLWDQVLPLIQKKLAGGKGLPDELLRSALRLLWRRLWDDKCAFLAKVEGWEKPERKPNQYGNPWKRVGQGKIDALPGKELPLFLMKIALIEELDPSQYSMDNKPSTLEACAATLKVDCKKAKAAVLAEFRLKAAGKSKTAKTPRKSGGKSTPGVCRVCGCTETTPCETESGEPCRWVEPDLCSACQEEALDTEEGGEDGEKES